VSSLPVTQMYQDSPVGMWPLHAVGMASFQHFCGSPDFSLHPAATRRTQPVVPLMAGFLSGLRCSGPRHFGDTQLILYSHISLPPSSVVFVSIFLDAHASPLSHDKPGCYKKRTVPTRSVGPSPSGIFTLRIHSLCSINPPGRGRSSPFTPLQCTDI